MISARIVKRFSSRRESAPFALDLDFKAGEGVTVIFGPSGAGKTLTLDSIAGFVRPDEGRILLDDRIVFDAQAGVNLQPQARRCGYVFQNYALFPHMSLRENLAFAAERLPRLERHRKTAEMLDRFRLVEVAGRKPHELSGGQKQRCSIARALIGAPSLLLLDEPARGLDAQLRAELYDVLRQVQRDFGTPVILVTHSVEEALELANEMLVLVDGRVVQSGSPQAVCEQPASVEIARLFGIFNIVAAEIRMLDPARNRSVLRTPDGDVAGLYYPGHLIGDRVQLCIAPEHIVARPRNGRPSENELALELGRAVIKPATVRLEFTNGLAAEIPRVQFDPQASGWVAELPARHLRLVS